MRFFALKMLALCFKNNYSILANSKKLKQTVKTSKAKMHAKKLFFKKQAKQNKMFLKRHQQTLRHSLTMHHNFFIMIACKK